MRGIMRRRALSETDAARQLRSTYTLCPQKEILRKTLSRMKFHCFEYSWMWILCKWGNAR